MRVDIIAFFHILEEKTESWNLNQSCGFAKWDHAGKALSKMAVLARPTGSSVIWLRQPLRSHLALLSQGILYFSPSGRGFFLSLKPQAFPLEGLWTWLVISLTSVCPLVTGSFLVLSLGSKVPFSEKPSWMTFIPYHIVFFIYFSALVRIWNSALHLLIPVFQHWNISSLKAKTMTVMFIAGLNA